jgi:hypothetical protein
MAVKNGCEMSWTQWSKQVGSIIALDMATDLGLDMLNAPGVLSQNSLSFSIDLKNLHPTDTIVPVLYCVVIYDGVLNVLDGTASVQNAILSKSDVMNAPEMSLSYNHSRNFYGGSKFWDSVKKISGQVWDGLKKGTKFAAKVCDDPKVAQGELGSKICPYIQQGSDIVTSLEKQGGRVVSRGELRRGMY